jgi:hypothetical protein
MTTGRRWTKLMFLPEWRSRVVVSPLGQRAELLASEGASLSVLTS